MSAKNVLRKIERRSAVAVVALTAMVAGMTGQALAGGIIALAPPTALKKVVNGKFAAGVDNGWVIYQGYQGQPTLNFFDTDTDGTLKLKTAGNGQFGNGLFFDAGGIVFAPCTPSSSSSLPGSGSNACTPSPTGPAGVGVGFGQATFGGAGGAAGGWTNDSGMTVHLTNANQLPGSIAGLAVDPTNGAFAVGWDSSSSTNHAIIWTLDSAGQTYAPVSTVDLGTLGGTTSSALGISHNAKYVVGIANTAANKGHAVYALTTDTAWTDISGALGTAVKSRAFAASDTGYVTGSVTVKRSVGGKMKSVDIGFVYSISGGTAVTFEAAGYNVVPVKVLNNGNVVGNLEALGSGAIKSSHPFLFNGTSLVDYGTMGGAFGCRVNGANNLGEIAGSCIPTSATPYGIGGTAFYINTQGAGTYVDVNAAVHANSDVSTPTVAPYSIGSVTAIDDEDEITFMAVKFVGGNPNIAAFLATKASYNP